MKLRLLTIALLSCGLVGGITSVETSTAVNASAKSSKVVKHHKNTGKKTKKIPKYLAKEYAKTLAAAKKLPKDIHLVKGTAKAGWHDDDTQAQAKMTNGHVVYWNRSNPGKAVERMSGVRKSFKDNYTNNTKHWLVYYVNDPKYGTPDDEWPDTKFGNYYDSYVFEGEKKDEGFADQPFVGRGLVLMNFSAKIMLVNYQGTKDKLQCYVEDGDGNITASYID
ncbi:hypothetical protein ACFP1H_03485 [Secundilactobacillus hailunensis]|uniref:Uncharacterized protein n=1 Tax=Secundilactobacillus hailunensis TaxID=2559923 RepID=A0ABW1T894_9LACO|nr:hypothetical protein [Secundilactobacillus hailunensis]